MNKSISIAFLFLLLFSGVSCYTFSGASIPAHIKTIGIPLASDNSGFGRSEIRQTLTTELSDKFTREGSLQVIDRAKSDALLEVTVSRISDDPINVKAGEELSTKRVTISVDAVYKDQKLQKTVWERNFSQFADYPVAQSLQGFNTALAGAIDKLTQDMLLGVISNW